jgi:hypothetical protein
MHGRFSFIESSPGRRGMKFLWESADDRISFNLKILWFLSKMQLFKFSSLKALPVLTFILSFALSGPGLPRTLQICGDFFTRLQPHHAFCRYYFPHQPYLPTIALSLS